ncbi:MAG: hypothetical protein KC621_33070 [Myxococcales bacterium]|nr:hypothetical protein [Myxococcales bacterium]
MRVLSTVVLLSTLLAGCEAIECSIAPDPTNEALQMNGLGCSGNILASGSLDNMETQADAELACEQSFTKASCCAYHLYGAGEWFATDGELVMEGGIPEEAEWGRAAGNCAVR